ncbi:hypothetical protein [Luteolibacter sp. LG18]|uniref:hypothetical protein n=1 Tax=Luteolibacter sp. LG18 TaxID=2819286 RepID=UPI0030C65A89
MALRPPNKTEAARRASSFYRSLLSGGWQEAFDSHEFAKPVKQRTQEEAPDDDTVAKDGEITVGQLQELMDNWRDEPSITDIRQPLVLTPTKEQFERWNRAAIGAEEGPLTIHEWAIQGLEELAEAREQENRFSIPPTNLHNTPLPNLWCRPLNSSNLLEGKWSGRPDSN